MRARNVDLYIRTERDSGRLYREFYADRLSFEDINFERFTFETSANSIRQFRVKKKKWKMIQFTFCFGCAQRGFLVFMRSWLSISRWERREVREY